MVSATRRFIGLASACCVIGGTVIPGFAQTNIGDRLADRERTSATASREYPPGGWLLTESGAVPNNLVVTSFGSLVEVMLRDSPTFRRQCQRLENTQMLTVRLGRPVQPLPPHTRARTRISRERSGMVVAEIEVPALGDDVELIAHEIEHVIEQLDNIDLAATAARPGTGVHVLSQGPVVFETTRAARIGRLVAEEVRRTGR